MTSTEKTYPEIRRSHRWRVAERRRWVARRGISAQNPALGFLEVVGRANGRMRRWPWELLGA
jgi:hypothetical protein